MNLKLLYYTALTRVWEYNSKSQDFREGKITMVKKYVIGIAVHLKMMTAL
jgi:hypothetical protein